jgi:hypothetical protein
LMTASIFFIRPPGFGQHRASRGSGRRCAAMR